MSILSFIDGYLKSGDAWEVLCVECYRQRYKDEHYTEVPAAQGGDGGIEGFTQNGVVNQCYCPEKIYSDDDLFEHLRDKMTTDIGKLVKTKYAKRLRDLGVPEIREWHFVIPEIRDARIIKHAESKRREVLALKEASPQDYFHIHDDFKILIKCAADFSVEIVRAIRFPQTDYLLNLEIQHNSTPDWSQCDSEKSNNIRRKFMAIKNTDDDSDDDVNFLVKLYIEFYINGLDIMSRFRLDVPGTHSALVKLEQACKRDFAVRTRINNDCSVNSVLFNDILEKFEEKLTTEFSSILDSALIGELKQDLVASWLADCSMEFRK